MRTEFPVPLPPYEPFSPPWPGVPGSSSCDRADVGGIVILFDSATITHRAELGATGLRHRFPTMFANKAYPEGGGLMSYGPDITAMFGRAVIYVDKILKGANPGDLPVEQPTQLQLTINVKTPKALGLTLPPPLQLRADDVVE